MKSEGIDGTHFKVTPATSPSAGFSISRSMLSAVGACFAINVAMTPAFVFFDESNSFLMGLIAIGFFLTWRKFDSLLKRWVLRKENTNRHSYETEIIVDSAGIRVPRINLSIAHADMHRLVIKNAFDNAVEVPMSSYAAVGSPITVGSAAVANAMTNSITVAYNNKIRAFGRISYQVTVEAGGASHIVAGGLTDVCAYGLMTDIDRALNKHT